MNYFAAAALNQNNTRARRPCRVAAWGLVVALGLTACGNKEQKPGQTLARVDGAEITVLQLNEELQRAGVQAGQQEVAKKQLLDALVDRQLLLNQAAKEQTERDPKVMQAIERAKSMIIAQAYIQKRLGVIAKPGKAEVDDYFQQHPAFFAQRKQFDLRELLLASKDIGDDAKKAIDGAKSLDEAAAWLDAHGVKYARGGVVRSSAELAPELVAKFASAPKGQLFLIREGERSLLMAVNDIREAPVPAAAAAPQIEQFLANKKTKAAADAEIARLRAVAKIEYPNPATAPAAAAAAPPGTPAQPDVATRGVAGLK